MMYVKSIQIYISVVYQCCSSLDCSEAKGFTSIHFSRVPVANTRSLNRERRILKSGRTHGDSRRTGQGLESSNTTLAERVYQQLKTDIIHGVFQPGEAMNEKVLAARYKGSRTPVREAIMRLQQEMLLRLVPQKGYFVSHLIIHELNEMYEYRAELEGFCAEVAAKRWADTALLDRLTELARTQYKTEHRNSYAIGRRQSRPVGDLMLSRCRRMRSH